MVEIIPYEEDDDDTSLWVPLAPLNPESPIIENSNNTAVTEAPGYYSGLHQYLSYENACDVVNICRDNNSSDRIDDNDEGDDQHWEELSSVPSRGQHRASPCPEHNPPPLNFWESQVVSHLVSTTSGISETISFTGNDDENDESSEIEENLPWRRIDSEHVTEFMSVSNQSGSTSCRYLSTGINTIHRDHESLSKGSYRLPPDVAKGEHEHRHSINPHLLEEQGNNDQIHNTPPVSISRDGQHGSVKIANNPKENDEKQRTGKNQVQSSKHSSQEILQQKLIHDPLRSLPSVFLRHFYRQFYGTVRSALESYVEENELPTILAPLTLAALLLIFGMLLVIDGVFGLGSLFLTFVLNSTRIVLAWATEGIWNLTKNLAFIFVVISLLLMLRVWRSIRRPRVANPFKVAGSSATDDSNFYNFSVLGISTLIPWIVACTSPAMYEAFIIFASTRVCLSVILSSYSSSVNIYTYGECPSYNNFNSATSECIASRSEDDPFFKEFSFVRPYNGCGPSTIQPVLLTLLVVVVVISSIIITANLSDGEHADDHNSEVGIGIETDATATMPSTTSTCAGDSSLDTGSSKKLASASCFSSLQILQNYSFHHSQIKKHLTRCHTVSIFTLAGISLFLSFLRSLRIEYQLYLRGGGSIWSLFTNTIGKLGVSVLHILFGLWIFLFVADKAVSTSEKCKHMTDQLKSGVHWNFIAKEAFKEAVVEVSSNVVWGSNKEHVDMFSDEDDALRLAILKWLVERWSVSSQPSMESDSTQPGDDSLSNNPEADEALSSESEATLGDCHSPRGLDGITENRNIEGIPIKTTSALPSYEALQNIIASIDADETIIPAIRRYKSILYSLPPSEHAVKCVVFWKMCPAIFMTLALSIWSIFLFTTRGIGLCLATCAELMKVKEHDSLLDDSTRFGIGKSVALVPVAIYFAIISAILYLEYLQVRHWFYKQLVSQHLNADRDCQTDQNEVIEKKHRAMAILLHGGMNDRGTPTSFVSLFLLRLWHHLTESISVLEASVPVVRCATVASTSVNLAGDALCLLDLASEIQKRGVLSGIGVIIWDSFCYHLSEELRNRKEGSQDLHWDEEVINGRYTTAAVGAMDRFGKLSRNLSSLMYSKADDDGPEIEAERITPE